MHNTAIYSLLPIELCCSQLRKLVIINNNSLLEKEIHQQKKNTANWNARISNLLGTAEVVDYVLFLFAVPFFWIVADTCYIQLILKQKLKKEIVVFSGLIFGYVIMLLSSTLLSLVR